MRSYVTVEDVDGVLGTGWEGEGDKQQAVFQANAYLNGLRLKPIPEDEPLPQALLHAGAELAREAAADRLYVDTSPAVVRKRVKAGSVETEREYAQGAQPQSGTMALINSLLEPWLAKRSATQLLGRL